MSFLVWVFNNRKRILGGLLAVLFCILGVIIISLIQGRGIEASGSSSLTIQEGQGALEFDGVDDYVDCGNDDSLNVFSTEGSKLITISLWIKRSNTGRDDKMLGKGKQGEGYYIMIRSNNRLRFTTLGVRDYDFTTTIEDTNWHHVVFVYDSSFDVSLYIDGNFKEKLTHGSVGIPSSEPFFIGRNMITYFNGLIDDVRIYNRVLSAEEVESIYNHKEVSAEGLVGHWKMDEGEGTTTDDASGNNNHGTIYGANWTTQWRGTLNGTVATADGLILNGLSEGTRTSPIYDISSAGVSGGSQISWEVETPFGKALDFSNASDKVSIDNDTSLQFGSDDFSVLFWFKTNKTSGEFPIGNGGYYSGEVGWNFYKGGSGGGMVFTINDGTTATSVVGLASGGGRVDDYQWYHVAGIRDGSSLKIYVDGELKGETDDNTGNITNNDPVFVGNYKTWDSFTWDGLIDDVRVYNQALTQEEIQEIMYREGTSGEEGLVGYWKFNESSGSTAFDSSGYGNDGSIIGATRVNGIQSSVNVQTNLSLDGGSSWQGWQSASNGGSIPGINSGVNLSNARLQVRHTLATEEIGVSPILGVSTIQIWGFGNPNVNGWAWSENIGWISFSNIDPGTEVPYGLNINPETMKLSGYIWSENIGWITFHQSVAGEPPSDPCPEDNDCMAVLDPDTFEFSGWARALNHGDGWSGWISLAGTATDSSPYGVYIDPDTLKFGGWAWGSGVIGWISFNSENEDPGTPEYYVYTTMDIGPSVTQVGHEWSYCLDTLHPLLSWETSKPSYGYQIEISKDSELENLIYQHESGPTGSTEHYPTFSAGTCDENGYSNQGVCDLEYGQDYWWRIKASSEGGLYGGWSEIGAFSVENTHHWPEPDYTYDPDPVRAKRVTQFIDQSKAYGDSSIASWSWTISGTEGVDYDFVSPQRIPVVEDLMLHLDASMISGLEDGEQVSLWEDMSGRGNDAINNDPATQPIFKENASSRTPTVGFSQNLDRSDPRHLDVTLASDHNPGYGPSVFAVVLIPNNIADGTRVGNVWGSYPETPNYNLELHTSGKTRWYWNSGQRDVYGSADLRTGELAVVSYHRDAVSGKLQTYINGTIDMNYDDSGTNTVYGQNWRLGRDYRSGNGIALIGDIAEFIVYERSLASDEREAVEQYLMDKWLAEGGIKETGPESQSPYIIFRLQGEYDVTLEVTDSSGYGPCAITKKINVEEAVDLEWREVSPTE